MPNSWSGTGVVGDASDPDLSNNNKLFFFLFFSGHGRFQIFKRGARRFLFYIRRPNTFLAIHTIPDNVTSAVTTLIAIFVLSSSGGSLVRSSPTVPGVLSVSFLLFSSSIVGVWEFRMRSGGPRSKLFENRLAENFLEKKNKNYSSISRDELG